MVLRQSRSNPVGMLLSTVGIVLRALAVVLRQPGTDAAGVVMVPDAAEARHPAAVGAAAVQARRRSAGGVPRV